MKLTSGSSVHHLKFLGRLLQQKMIRVVLLLLGLLTFAAGYKEDNGNMTKVGHCYYDPNTEKCCPDQYQVCKKADQCCYYGPSKMSWCCAPDLKCGTNGYIGCTK